MSARNWTDEQLSAFIDDELSGADASLLSNDLVNDAKLHARHERLLAADAAFLGSVAGIDERPLPAGVRAALSSANAAQAAGQGAETVVAFRSRRFGGVLMKHRGAAAGLVAAAAMFGVMTGTQAAIVASAIPVPGQTIAENSAFGRMLDGEPSAQTVKISGDIAATARLTFARQDGTFCRQYDTHAGGQRSSSIACREEGGWRVLVAAATTAATQDGDYATASAQRSPALEGFLDAEMVGSPLDAGAEAKAMHQHWR